MRELKRGASEDEGATAALPQHASSIPLNVQQKNTVWILHPGRLREVTPFEAATTNGRIRSGHLAATGIN